MCKFFIVEHQNITDCESVFIKALEIFFLFNNILFHVINFITQVFASAKKLTNILILCKKIKVFCLFVTATG